MGRLLRLLAPLAALIIRCGAALPFQPGAVAVIPEDGRSVFLQAFDRARKEIRIEICVLEDPEVLQGLTRALKRGVKVRVIVDQGKYLALRAERENLDTYLTTPGGELHLSNPLFPRSFPKVTLIDRRYVLVGSCCLDTTTFESYRDYVTVSDDTGLISDLGRLFENDWRYTRPPNVAAPPLNPTPLAREAPSRLLVSPVTSSERLVAFFQRARHTLDVTSELLGNPTLQSELLAAVERGVRVRLISPLFVNGATAEIQRLQNASLALLAGGGVSVRVTLPPKSAKLPYMHARTAVRDGKELYLGSISLSPESIEANREVGLLLGGKGQAAAVKAVRRRFEGDFADKSSPLPPPLGGA